MMVMIMIMSMTMAMTMAMMVKANDRVTGYPAPRIPVIGLAGPSLIPAKQKIFHIPGNIPVFGKCHHPGWKEVHDKQTTRMGLDHLTWMQRWQRLESLAGPKFLLPLKEVYREVFQLLLSLSGAIHGCDSTGIGQGLVMALRHQQIPKLTFKGFPDPCMKSCDGLSHKTRRWTQHCFW